MHSSIRTNFLQRAVRPTPRECLRVARATTVFCFSPVRLRLIPSRTNNPRLVNFRRRNQTLQTRIASNKRTSPGLNAFTSDANRRATDFDGTRATRTFHDTVASALMRCLSSSYARSDRHNSSACERAEGNPATKEPGGHGRWCLYVRRSVVP